MGNGREHGRRPNELAAHLFILVAFESVHIFLNEFLKKKSNKTNPTPRVVARCTGTQLVQKVQCDGAHARGFWVPPLGTTA